MNVQKLNEILRIFEIIKQDFSSNKKRKNLFFCTCIVLDPDINLKNGPKISFWRTNWIRKFLYGLFFGKDQNF